MVISYAEINSESGPFVFIRLLEPIDDRKQDILGWANHLSRIHFDNRPVAVAHVDQNSQRILKVFPAKFAPVLQNMSWAGIFLSTASVDDIPPLRASGRQDI
jgi:hypothetical protein